MKVTKGLIEQHIHGAFGIDFMTCTIDELFEVSYLLAQNGISAFFPVIMTADLSVIKERIAVIKEAMYRQKKKTAQIIGVHLEGPFINPEKAGIHEKKYIQPLNINIYKEIEDEIIKIITLAPELDYSGDFITYLKSKNIKLSCGHSESCILTNMAQVTHLYNAMSPFHHRNLSTVTAALCDDSIYTEIIADSMHVNDEVLKITFKQKPKDKIILISDALPLAHSEKKEHVFAGQKIYNKNGRLVNCDNVFAGSSMLLCDIIKNLTDKKIVKFEDAICFASSNIAEYHNLSNNLNVFWNEFNIIEKVEYI